SILLRVICSAFLHIAAYSLGRIGELASITDLRTCWKELHQPRLHHPFLEGFASVLCCGTLPNLIARPPSSSNEGVCHDHPTGTAVSNICRSTR
ncbi:hypothetical protein PIB30_053122, partial [Stylosanthes scabra]|nr:hypothetical protein [Stylosanthes scabra]